MTATAMATTTATMTKPRTMRIFHPLARSVAMAFCRGTHVCVCVYMALHRVSASAFSIGFQSCTVCVTLVYCGLYMLLYASVHTLRELTLLTSNPIYTTHVWVYDHMDGGAVAVTTTTTATSMLSTAAVAAAIGMATVTSGFVFPLLRILSMCVHFIRLKSILYRWPGVCQ